MRTISLLLGLLVTAPALSATALTIDQLQQVPVGGTIRIAAPDSESAKRSGDLLLRRVEVYSRDARVRLIEDGVERVIGRSTRALFATDRGASGTRAFLSVASDGSVRGLLSDLSGARAFDGRWADGTLQVKSVRPANRPDTAFQCGGSPAPPASVAGAAGAAGAVAAFGSTGAGAGATVGGRAAAKGLVAGLEAVVAVDTDTEFLSLKFGGDTTAANNYIAELFAGINAIYSTDLGVTLMVGDVLLYAGSDPYNSTSADSTVLQLNEFGEHWRVTHPTVPRAFAAQLSGKSGNANSASGIAWQLSNDEDYCASTGTVFGSQTAGHFSITRVFRFSTDAVYDVSIVGHEIGHNFGAAHTHCTDADPGLAGTQHVDQCYIGEFDAVHRPTCYNGSVTSCPTEFPEHGGSGTLMSYCHLKGCGGGNVMEFHPVHQVLLAERVAENVGYGCITAGAGGGDLDGVFRNGFEGL